MNLEKELESRIYLHKAGIVGGILMKEYIHESLQDENNTMPYEVLEEKADEYSDKVIKELIKEEVFDTYYNKVWEDIKDELPDNLIFT